MKLSALAASSAVLFALAAPVAAEPQAEVLHWWTSGGEAKAVGVLQEEFSANGGTWTDMPVAGGGGDAAMTALRARVLSGNAPAAVQLKGPAIQEWYEEGVLADISSVAEAEGWADVLPASIAEHMKCEGQWCAAPVNVHRVDWIWANAEVLAANGIEMPTTWDEFNAAADKLKEAGVIPLAHGGQAWQDATVFEVVALGLLGPDGFKKAFVDLDADTLNSPEMVAVFDQMRKMRGYVDENFPGRDWNLATAMVMNGEAAFQIMGDWAQGEFQVANQVAGEDYTCLPGLGVNEVIMTGGDAFYFPKVDDPAITEAQGELAKVMLSPEAQVAFNLKKGSLPVRGDVDLAAANDCMKKGLDILAKGNVIQSPDQLMSADSLTQVNDLFVEFFNNPSMTAEDAQSMFASIVGNAD